MDFAVIPTLAQRGTSTWAGKQPYSLRLHKMYAVQSDTRYDIETADHGDLLTHRHYAQNSHSPSTCRYLELGSTMRLKIESLVLNVSQRRSSSADVYYIEGHTKSSSRIVASVARREYRPPTQPSYLHCGPK